MALGPMVVGSGMDPASYYTKEEADKKFLTKAPDPTKQQIIDALGYTPPKQDTTYGNATTSKGGLMSATDKANLDAQVSKYILQTSDPGAGSPLATGKILIVYE